MEDKILVDVMVWILATTCTIASWLIPYKDTDDTSTTIKFLLAGIAVILWIWFAHR